MFGEVVTGQPRRDRIQFLLSLSDLQAVLQSREDADHVIPSRMALLLRWYIGRPYLAVCRKVGLRKFRHYSYYRVNLTI